MKRRLNHEKILEQVAAKEPIGNIAYHHKCSIAAIHYIINKNKKNPTKTPAFYYTNKFDVLSDHYPTEKAAAEAAVKDEDTDDFSILKLHADYIKDEKLSLNNYKRIPAP